MVDSSLCLKVREVLITKYAIAYCCQNVLWFHLLTGLVSKMHGACLDVESSPSGFPIKRTFVQLLLHSRKVCFLAEGKIIHRNKLIILAQKFCKESSFTVGLLASNSCCIHLTIHSNRSLFVLVIVLIVLCCQHWARCPWCVTAHG